MLKIQKLMVDHSIGDKKRGKHLLRDTDMDILIIAIGIIFTTGISFGNRTHTGESITV